MRRVSGLCLIVLGLFFVLFQLLWTTGNYRDRLPVPQFPVNILVFCVGLVGLLAVYVGFRRLHGRKR